MAYGHMPLFFANAVEAQEFLDSCERGNNYMAESYQDRVNAQRCIRQAAGWSPPPIREFEKPKVTTPAPAARRRRTA